MTFQETSLRVSEILFIYEDVFHSKEEGMYNNGFHINYLTMSYLRVFVKFEWVKF